MRTVIVGSFRYRYEGEFAKQILRDAGIESVLSADDAAGLRPDIISVQPVRLSVLATDSERALQVLRDHDLASPAE